LAALLGGCDKQEAPPPAQQEQGTLVTLIQVARRDVPVMLDSSGRIEARTAPEVAAEVEGRVVAVPHDAGANVRAGAVLARLEDTQPGLEEKAAAAELARNAAQTAQDSRTLERNKELAARGFISPAALETSATQLDMQIAAHEAARARLEIARDRLAKTRVVAPVSGTIESRKVSVGDHVKAGDPMFLITRGGALRALLPFPETVARHLRPGQKVTLASPLAPDENVHGLIGELRPVVGAGSRAVTAVVDFANPGSWRPGATVTGLVEIAVHQNALLVPEMSVVRRPAGELVYVVHDGKARQTPVRIGERAGGMVEILAGLDGSETVAVDGAAYLSDGAAVRVGKNTP
jgi:RND family efflux transporter MFP subunit